MLINLYSLIIYINKNVSSLQMLQKGHRIWRAPYGPCNAMKLDQNSPLWTCTKLAFSKKCLS